MSVSSRIPQLNLWAHGEVQAWSNEGTQL
jgi:hypothetical protein